jgi:hypothetical protein
MNLRSALKAYKRDAVRNALVSLIEDRLDARIRENVPCGRGWVGNKGKGKKCKRAAKGSAEKQMRVKRKRLGKSAEPPKAMVKTRDIPGKKMAKSEAVKYEESTLARLASDGGSKFYKTGDETKTVEGIKSVFPKAKHVDIESAVLAETRNAAKKANVDPKLLEAAIKDPGNPKYDKLKRLTMPAVAKVMQEARNSPDGVILSGYEKARKYGATQQDILSVTEPAGTRGAKTPFAIVVASEKTNNIGYSRGSQAPKDWGGKGGLMEQTSTPFPLSPTPIKPREGIAPQEQRRNKIGRETDRRIRDKVKNVLAGQSEAIAKINQQKNTKKGLEDKFLKLELLTGIKNRDILKSVGEASGLDLTYKPRKKKT